MAARTAVDESPREPKRGGERDRGPHAAFSPTRGKGRDRGSHYFSLARKKASEVGGERKEGRSKRRPPPPPLPAFSSSPCPSPPQSWSGGRGVNRQTLRRATGEKVTRKETEAESGKENAVVYNPVPQKFLALSFLLPSSPLPVKKH